jgi:hypothetical protein
LRAKRLSECHFAALVLHSGNARRDILSLHRAWSQ